MFDKNAFKNAFQQWALASPQSTPRDALVHCRELIVPSDWEAAQWLVEECLAYHGWLLEAAQEKGD